MLPQWFERVLCRVIRGHNPDVAVRGAHVWFANRPSIFEDPIKTRRTECGKTLYVRYRRRARRWR
jgi:hypothetical protein